MLTESRNPRSTHIDQLTTLEMLHIMNDEDATVATTVRQALPQIARAVDAIVTALRDGGRLIYVGAGTSGRIGVLDASECVPTFGTPPELVRGLIAGGPDALTTSIEGAEDDADAGRADLLALALAPSDAVVGIAASGRTPYVIGALEAANEIGALTIAIACNSPAPILERAQIAIAAPVGPEVITGSTRLKAGTAQKLIVNMLSTASMIRMGKVYQNLMVDVQITNQKLARRARGIVVEVTGCNEEQAQEWLVACHNEVKTAIVVGLLGISPDDARQRLHEHQGMLRPVIE